MSNSAKNTADLHDKAMQLANEAFLLEQKGHYKKAKKIYNDAFDFERDAAMLLVNDFEIEPSRSVLFRSAANLALKATLYREAERMAAFGLSGNPPDEIADELREVLNQSLKGLKLVA